MIEPLAALDLACVLIVFLGLCGMSIDERRLTLELPTRAQWIALPHAAIALAVLALLMPWLTLATLYDFPRAMAVRYVPVIVWNVVILVALAAWVARHDRWLGVFVGFLALNALRAPWPASPFLTAQWALFGAISFVLLRRLVPWKRHVALLLGVSGLAQTAISALQRIGWDPYWPADAPYQGAGTMTGTIGNDTWLGAYLAIVGAVAPAWMTPFLFVGIALAQNRLGALALIVALLVRWRHRRDAWLGAIAMLLLAWRTQIRLDVPELVPWWWIGGKSLDSIWARLEAWQLGLRMWWEHAIVFGLGPGGWAWYVPQFQHGDRLVQAHNEGIQMLVEGGAVGAGLAIAWILAHRRALRRSPAAWAVAIVSLGTFPFHLAVVGLTAVLVVALELPTSAVHGAGEE